MTWICYVGIEVSANFQKILLGIELTMLFVLSIVALVKVGSGHAPPGHLTPSISWLNPFHISSFSAFTAGIMHDIGRLGLLVAYPDRYERIIREVFEPELATLSADASDNIGVDHVDFLLIRRDQEITVDVPLVFVGTPEGVRLSGALLEHFGEDWLPLTVGASLMTSASSSTTRSSASSSASFSGSLTATGAASKAIGCFDFSTASGAKSVPQAMQWTGSSLPRS